MFFFTFQDRLDKEFTVYSLFQMRCLQFDNSGTEGVHSFSQHTCAITEVEIFHVE